MTTTLVSCVDMENPVQCLPQESAPSQSGPSPNRDPSLGPTAQEHTTSTSPQPSLARDGDMDRIVANAQAKQLNSELCALSKTFGNIPNVPIFTQWDYRKDCCSSAVHRSCMAGICGNSKDGAYSIALSNLYTDDEDNGDVIIYTGAGGRKRWTDSFPPRRMRIGPQIFDQSWDDPQNRALVVSSLTRNPVRVIRSWKCRSEYAPVKGYRYDGLYTVTDVWTATGHNKKKICRCRLERLPNQPPIPVLPLGLSASRRRRGEPLVSRPSCSPSPSINTCDTSEMDSDTRHPNASIARSEENTEGGPEGFLNRQEQRATPDASASDIDFETAEADDDIKDFVTPHPRSPQRTVSANLPRYRWDSKTNQLIRLPALPPIPEVSSTTEREEGNQGEDEVTLVMSEDGRADVKMTPANERMETEYFSDGASSDDSGPTSDKRVMENQGDN